MVTFVASVVLLYTSVITFAFAFSPDSCSSPPCVVSKSKYTTPHTLGDTDRYTFNSRDGWMEANLTNLMYKYSDSSFEDSSDNSGDSNIKKRDVIASIKGVAASVWKGLKGIGQKQDATITWYTGNDLKNPSCWSQPDWAPTDKSFACALTLEGWTNRPQCFKFLELCNGPTKCIFVRVVDTCAGCAKGSKHIDLTRAAFSALASLDEGTLTAQFRLSTDPTGWFEDLWGPKA